MTEFDIFWQRYPRRIGKIAALKAYQRARTVATADEILAGVENYRKHLPEEARFICHASTFLSQGRWMDEYDDPAPKAERYTWTCPHTPECPSAIWCDVKTKTA